MKKRSYWVLLGVMVLVGAFLLVFLASQNQLPVVPDVNAQGLDSYNLGAYGGIAPQNVLFSLDGARYGVAPQNVLFSASPHNVLLDGGSLTTLMTCSGCAQTMSTCDWYCGPTFSTCGSACYRSGAQGSLFGIYGSGKTLMTCSGSSFGGCGGGYTSIICGGGVSTSFTCGGVQCAGLTYLNCPTKPKEKEGKWYTIGDFGWRYTSASNTINTCNYSWACAGGGTMVYCSSGKPRPVDQETDEEEATQTPAY